MRDKRVIILGGSSGIGLAVAEQASSEGAKVVVSVLDQVAGAVSQTRSYADTVLNASETVATAAAKLQENVDDFLSRVAI